MTDRLYRSHDDRMLAGVAGGLAELWDADPSLVRIVWALLVIFTGGLALVVYIVMAIVVPEEGDVASMAPRRSADPGWPSGTPAPGPPAASPGTGPAPGTGGSAAFTDPAGVAASAPPATTWVSPGEAREARRQSRAARRATRRDRGGVPGGAIGGVILVAIGGFFLARQWMPTLDFDWFWPLILVGLGILLIVIALTRRPEDPGPP